MPTYLPETDLAEINDALLPLVAELKLAKIFMTGGTGFFGIWLIQSFLALNQHYNLQAELFILSRNPFVFLEKYPLLKNSKNLNFISGDIKTFVYPEIHMTHLIHAATTASHYPTHEAALGMLDTAFLGTKHLLDYCVLSKIKPKILLISSGAVYGEQPAEVTHIAETAATSPHLYKPTEAYAIGKCMAEHLCYQYFHWYQLPIKIARCFSFIGPYLPLNSHFAMGNFIADYLAGRAIVVKTKNPVFRSYQYMSDLIIWLWTILLIGQSGTPYNVGSDEGFTLHEIAQWIAAQHKPELAVFAKKLDKTAPPSRYVPSVQFAKISLGLYNRVKILNAIERTLAWYTQAKNHV